MDTPQHRLSAGLRHRDRAGLPYFHLPNAAKLSRTGDGFVSLGAALLAYGLTQLAHGYGFLAVFVAALCLRHASRDHSYRSITTAR